MIESTKYNAHPPNLFLVRAYAPNFMTNKDKSHYCIPHCNRQSIIMVICNLSYSIEVVGVIYIPCKVGYTNTGYIDMQFKQR